jgi:hypothetical protein
MDTRAGKPGTTARPARAKSPWPAQLWIRRLHLYGGVLFAPTILFFALTGAAQVYDLHKANPKANYGPPELVIRLAALHKDQSFALPHKDDAGRKAPKPEAAGQPKDSKLHKRMGMGQILLKAFATAAAFGLCATTALGLYMAYRSPRDRWLTSALLAAGVIVPIVLAAIG